jgi:hypothetical protein
MSASFSFAGIGVAMIIERQYLELEEDDLEEERMDGVNGTLQ